MSNVYKLVEGTFVKIDRKPLTKKWVVRFGCIKDDLRDLDITKADTIYDDFHDAVKALSSYLGQYEQYSIITIYLQE